MLSIYSVLPLLRDSVGILMQRTPRELDHVLPGCYQRVRNLSYDNYRKYIEEVTVAKFFWM